jgi:hypothetical protein
MSVNIFQNAFDRLVSARERQVRRYVNGALLAMDDAQLKSIGRTRAKAPRPTSSKRSGARHDGAPIRTECERLPREPFLFAWFRSGRRSQSHRQAKPAFT